MTDSNLTVSVVMCTHNGMEFIEEQLESILNQTQVPDELIISDDDSSDGTLEFAIEYVNRRIQSGKNLSNLVLRTQKNVPALGITKNFESAISLAQCDVVALCDQDDVWVSNKLEIMSSYFVADPSLTLLHTNASLVNENNSKLGISLFEALRVSSSELRHIQNGHALGVLARRNLVTGATVIFRKSMFKYISHIPEGWLHDEFIALIASGTGKVNVLTQELINYRQHGSNQVGARKPGLKQLAGRVLHPGLERNQILLKRAQNLADNPFISSLPGKAALSILVKQNLDHEVARSGYSSSRLKRFPKVISEVKTGRYNSVGLGFPDIIRDLLQPLDK